MRPEQHQADPAPAGREAADRAPARSPLLPSLRLHTRFLLSMALVTAGLTTLSLLVVRTVVEREVRASIADALQHSAITFQTFQQEREALMMRSAELLAYLPITRALMTSHDAATIQDASEDLWRLAGTDLLVLADRRGAIVALHARPGGLSRETAQPALAKMLEDEDLNRWWYGEGRLYQTFAQPIYFGSRVNGLVLGYLVIGAEVDERLAKQISRVTANQVAFSYNGEVVATTLDQTQARSAGLRTLISGAPAAIPLDVDLGSEHFLGRTIDLAPTLPAAVRLSVLGSYDQQTEYLRRLNRLLLMLGLVAILTGALLVSLLSHAFTRPLANLVAGVRALERGDFHHPLDSRGRDEVAELTRVFEGMRSNLLKTQQDLLEAEQLATIGRMASSISHDLRHSLSAITANAEFLSEGGLSREQREELYAEVRAGVRRMTDLIDSLLEFARTRESLNPGWGNVRPSVETAIQGVRKLPRHAAVKIEAHYADTRQAFFDGRRLERALFNLLLNACDAAPEHGGIVEVDVSDSAKGTAITVSDNGPGIADAIRETMFQPFVSFGKQNGTGLGLTIAQKIVHDHGGSITMERRNGRTAFRMVLPYPPFARLPGTVIDQRSLGPVTELSRTEGRNRA